ncbi:RNA polymerase sigma factor (sigma-70 family) [Streptomyces sp. TLI_55]|uniref:sigma factor n=1 Tax=Streptomyces sp. TLI_55 TaxID=1938861 RepID=UPI000BCEC4FF|nr:sigma-70 family RNA polymerase sigma factor [Streptomyces sp. TLI_55]SNX63227.1 RNA polymerase sigma factor (sigma-70 family) [Streptomyces sp. TLI_55]
MSDGSTASPFSYARMYEEQQPRLIAYARSLTRNSWNAEDLVAEAHFRVWRRLAEGHEIENVPAYLMTTVRHLASAAAGSAVRETPREVVPAQAQAPEGGDPAERVSVVDLLVRVLGQLPERWVKALWLAEAEGQPLAAIGPQVGTKDGATAVLLHRAREGMRQAFLRTQTGAPDDPACQVHWARMPAYVRGAATERQSARLLGHVDGCDDCRARLAALMSANDRLPALVGPALLVFAVGGAGKYLLTAATVGAGGVKGGVLDGVRHVTAGGAKAATAAGAVVASAAVLILALGPGYSTPTPAERTPVAEAPVGRVPVAKGPRVVGPGAGTPVADAPVAGARGDDDSTSVRAASAQRGGGASVGTRTHGGDEPAAAPRGPGDDSVPASTEPAPEQPAPPTDDTPEKPQPPAQGTPEEPTPPADNTPAQPVPPADNTPEQPTPPADNTPEQPAPPADNTPEQPAPPADNTPEQPAPPADGTPAEPAPPADNTPEQPAPPGEPSTPTPTPVPAPSPVPDPAPPADPNPNPNPQDPDPVSPAPVNPPPVENPAPVDPSADPPAYTPPPTTPPPTTTTPEPTEPPVTADPTPDPDPEPNAPEPTAPGDGCPHPEGPDSPAQD